jgi:septal ring factor EnvC (AmiA/AmiB activator)
MKLRLTLILFFTIPCFYGQLAAQSTYEQRRAEIVERQLSTRSQIEALEDQIKSYADRLNIATERYEETYRQYQELTRLISLQQERIRQLRQEQRHINDEIKLIETNVKLLEAELSRLIEQYKETLIYLYKHGRTTELALVLSSTSINQLLVRSYYLSKFDDHRRKQAEQIESAQREFELSRADLEVSRERNTEVLAEIQVQTAELQNQEALQKRNVEAMQRDQTNLQNQLSITRQQAQELIDVLNQLDAEEERVRLAEADYQRRLAIARSIADENEREAAVARLNRGTVRELAVSEDEIAAFETKFRSRKGQLPWPVEGGTITEKFGVRRHPVFRTETPSLGVDIAVPANSTVRAVNDGYVVRIQPFPGYGDLVMVNHGQYITAYGNLSTIYVNQNQVLRQGDLVGLSGDTDSMRGEVLFFLVREGGTIVNPELWLQRATP